ncbi:alpha/beta hydrolase [Ulvibacter antarcticus]|uniref:Putative esterase n=1 Tax=Ulvibacter antarcticus TaxID=442714 RepID=A0A3L9YL84_9FLAO|nr:esterase [Ulvibacter antarcticus]RMA58905.1 putative esterase [Ulvibacter antarcticus]
MAQEKKVSYTTSNTYCTANKLSPKTKNVWLVFHGMGYLSRYFINYFSDLDGEENFIIAPQAPSKYYLGSKFKHVGACWLTKENTEEDTINVLKYIDEVFASEKPENMPNFIILGYSQGVSIAMRWMASRKINCNHLVLHSGGIPKELKKEDFTYLSKSTKVTYLFGNKDEYITEARKTEETLKGSGLFGNRVKTVQFEGVHEVNRTYLKMLSKEK